MTLPKELTTVTHVSRIVAVIVLVTVMIIGFGLGITYQETIDLLKKQNNHLPVAALSKPTTPTPEDTANWKTYMFGKVSFKYPPNYIVKTNGALGPPVNIADLRDANISMSIDISEKSNTEYNDFINSYIPSTAFSNIKKELIQNGILITADGPGYPKKALWVLAFLRKNNTTIYIGNTGYDVPKNIFDQILSTFRFD